MLAVVRVYVVFRLQSRTEADDGRLFTEIEVTIATNAGLLIHLHRFLLEATDEHHLVIVLEQRLTVLPLWDGSLSLLAGRCSALRICLLLAFRVQIAPDPFLLKGSDYGVAKPCAFSSHENMKMLREFAAYDPGAADSSEAGTFLAPQRGQRSGCSSLCTTSPHTGHTQRSATSLTRSARLTMPTSLPWSRTGRRLMRSCTRRWLTSSRSVSGVTLMTPRVIMSPTVCPSLLMTSYSVTTPTTTFSLLTTGKPLMRC